MFMTPNGKEIPSRLLRPTAITRDNLHLVLEADWITHGVLCAGVPIGEVAACD
jgi:D-xylose transport system substrate-binding protein